MVIKYVIRGGKVTESDGKKTVVAHLPDVGRPLIVLGLMVDMRQMLRGMGMGLPTRRTSGSLFQSMSR